MGRLRGYIPWRIGTGLILAWIGWEVSRGLVLIWPWPLLLILGGAVLGASVGPQLTVHPFNRLLTRLSQVPSPSLIAGVVGLLIAMLIASLATSLLPPLPGLYGLALPLLLGFLLSYAFITLLVKKSTDFFHLFGLKVEGVGPGVMENPLLVDTSVFIDGRLADVVQSGFLTGKLVVPSFVLQEMQRVADATDPLRRRRGRRGLEMLAKLQKEGPLPVEIREEALDEGEGVDGQLVKLARGWHCPIITTDFNLRRVAEVQGVKVLNLNDLATALKPVVMPGEEMELRMVQEGKEVGQGVGFMEDGTMVVVEGGKRYLGNQIAVVVTRVLQTPMGRMIFAQPREGEGRRG